MATSTRPIRLSASPASPHPRLPELDAMLERIQNDLFDLGADLATPPSDQPLGYEPLRIVHGAGHPA